MPAMRRGSQTPSITLEFPSAHRVTGCNMHCSAGHIDGDTLDSKSVSGIQFNKSDANDLHSGT